MLREEQIDIRRKRAAETQLVIEKQGKGRVFGTTLGHASPTTDMESFHKLLANGLLWAWGRNEPLTEPAPHIR